ncbi:MAG: glycerol-3-phosphate 1-O-acyltransferase PlsY [Kiritimatiellae bacterium]|nr:glycerol-3-phosphate 1-O-acyltransferase PlsY [Kiritimatiellia bacterium]
MQQALVSAACGYLLGSVPFGYLAGRLRGVDIRKVGSGNIGATNVWRTLGRGPGAAVFLLDALKGALAASLFPSPAAALSGAVGAMLGHSFPVFLGFKGGKGVATGLGVAVGLVPHSAALGLAVWIAVFLCSRYVSLASVAAAAAVGAAPWFLDRGGDGCGRIAVCAAVSALAALVVLKHRGNMVRLVRGTENRFCFTKKQLEARARKENGDGVR